MSKKAAAEKARLEAALKAASDDARRMYATHDKERQTMEQQDRGSLDVEHFERIRERERLRKEELAYFAVQDELKEFSKRILAEAAKHEHLERLRQASWLPDVNSEAQISAFLNRWKEEQEYALGMMDDETIVHMKMHTGANDRNATISNMVVQRLDTLPSASYRCRRVDDDIDMCVKAVQLSEEIWKASDAAVMAGDKVAETKHREHLQMVYRTIRGAMDRLTCLVGLNVECFGDPEDDFLLIPTQEQNEKRPQSLIKYGLWLRTAEKRHSVNTGILYHGIDISIDPKDPTASLKLPRALNITQNPLATVRVIQYNFDPCSVEFNEREGQKYIALDCVLVIESMTLPDKTKKIGNGDWSCRTETTAKPTLHVNEYPPQQKKGEKLEYDQLDQLMVLISFVLPKNVAIRQNHLKIGKWNKQGKKWEHIAVATMTQQALRKFAFRTMDLTTLAVIQEKDLEVPYESWRIIPISDDEVLLHLLGKIPDGVSLVNDPSAREIQIVIREDKVKLIGPEDPELSHLRGIWMCPASLMRLMARAGYNFLLTDADGADMPTVLTKTQALEEKGYRDISLFAYRFAIASSRHNKAGEDPDMALFRLSKQWRPDTDDVSTFDPKPSDESKWHSIRYETTRCALSQFQESDDDAVLSTVQGHETHLNLYKCLAAAYTEDEIDRIAKYSNPLLQQGIHKMLALIRPFSWG